MVSTFTPYWRQFGSPRDPYSFVFFVVAEVAGHHRPISVVSSRGPAEPEDDDGLGSLQGFPLTAACKRIITIFSEKANRASIKAELSIAAAYYLREGEDYRPEPVELRENDAKDRHHTAVEIEPWDHVSVREFPFITACLLQGVAFDPQESVCVQATPQPLGTVYRDTSIEYGMVVVDITELNAVRYGIVGFAAMPMMWVPSLEALSRQTGHPSAIVPPSNAGGELRVLDQVRSRSVMSAAEYLNKVPGPTAPPEGEQITKMLAQTPLVRSKALAMIWPDGSELDMTRPMVDLSIGTKNSPHEQSIRSIIQSTIDTNDFDIFVFDGVRKVPNFKEMLQRNLLHQAKRLGDTRSAGLLLRLAFEDGEHLSLERLNDLSVGAIQRATNIPELGTITSISLCASTIRNLPTGAVDLIEGLSQSASLREIHFLQSPLRTRDTPDVELLSALAARPQFFSSIEVMFAGSYSAALRKVFWLPSTSSKTSTLPPTFQAAPLFLFPMQQILISFRRDRSRDSRSAEYATSSIYLGDALLTPSRFAAGFLAFLPNSTFPVKQWEYNSSARLFAFSSAPASFAESSMASAEISPVPAESFALRDDKLPDAISPRIRDLELQGWSVLLTSGRGWDPKTSTAELRKYSDHIRYAMVRPRKQAIKVASPPSSRLSPDDLEVVGLKEFLAITAPHVNPELVDRRLRDVNEHLTRLAQRYTQPGLQESAKLVDVLGHEEAADMLLACLKDARGLDDRLRTAMEDSEGQRWYPELLQANSDV